MKKIFLACGMALLMSIGLFAQNNQQNAEEDYYRFNVDKKVEHMAEKLDLNATQKEELRDYFMTIAREHDQWYINNPHKREMIQKKREWVEKKRKWNRSKCIAHEKKMQKILGIKKYKMYQELEKANKKAIKKQQKIEKKRRKEMHKRRKKRMYP